MIEPLTKQVSSYSAATSKTVPKLAKTPVSNFQQDNLEDECAQTEVDVNDEGFKEQTMRLQLTQ